MAARSPRFSPGHEVDLYLATELLGAPAAERVTSLQDPPGLHVCPACQLPFVLPGHVREVVGSDRVRLDLDCVNCGWTETSVRHDRELVSLDMHLDRSYADLLWTLEVVWIANEESAIERFTSALDADAILPEDF
jgi:hypothetical protein